MSEVYLSIEQLQCLASPMRRDVFNSLVGLRQAAVADIANECGISSHTAHFHVRALLNAGLIQVVGTQAGTKRPSALFAPVARAFKIPEGAKSEQEARVISASVLAGLRRTVRNYEKSIETSGPDAIEDFLVLHTRLRLGAPDKMEFLKRINATMEFAREHEDISADPLSFNVILFPKTSTKNRSKAQE